MTRSMQVDWERLLLVFLHDPVDKALDIRGHESRAARYAARALGREVSHDEIKGEASLADSLAEIAQSHGYGLPMPTAGRNGERAVGLEDGRLEVRHPVSGRPATLKDLALDESGVADTIDAIVDGLPDPRSRFLALWRLLPERLAERPGGDFARLPADTRVPDHTLLQHADITSGIWASRDGAQGGACLSLSLGPVQSFIEAARSVRDLWSGSAILSWLTFKGICPVLEALGPTALVYPALRGNPLMDLWLLKQDGLQNLVSPPSEASRRSPSIPNRFVALVPWGPDGAHARELADACAEAVRNAWRGLANDVHARLEPKLGKLDPEWARHWQDQVDSFFDVATTVMPLRPLDDATLARLIGNKESFDEVWPESGRVRSLADVIPEGERPAYDQHAAGRWQAQLEASARLMEAKRSIRHVPATSSTVADQDSPPKCSLLGSYEQMGPSDLEKSRRFWEQAPETIGSVEGVRLRKGERFCAVALCKRFAAPATLARELHLDKPHALRFPDTATVAAAEWLHEAGIEPDKVRREHNEWSGPWLHQKHHDDAKEGENPPPDQVWVKIQQQQQDPPPAYYAVLAMDADHMGQSLKGELAPTVQETLHPKMLRYYQGLGETATAGLSARRPVGPALHASISEALNNFASHIAPGIVENHRGTMIYSGGDDILALLPMRQAVACADELRRAFRGGDEDTPGWTRAMGRQLLLMGHKATLSAGIAFVHHMQDLRLALDAAREAEKTAKSAGRNLLRLHFMRRSGEHAQATLPWTCTGWFQDLVQRFAAGATDRWAYRLRAELTTLEGHVLPDAAVSAEIRRLVDRSQDDAALGPGELAGTKAEQWWHDFFEARCQHAEDSRRSRPLPAECLTDFVLLCQGASFMARGRDD